MSFLLGVSCDYFFPEPIWRSHFSTDFNAKWLKRRGFTHSCAFWSENRNFLKPLTHRPQNRQNLPHFGRDGKFSLDYAFNIGGLTSKHHLIFIGVIVNRQCGGGKFKYVPKFCIGGTACRSRDIAHAQWRFALDRHFRAKYLENARR